MPGEHGLAEGDDRVPNEVRRLSRRDVLKSSGLVSFVPVHGIRERRGPPDSTVSSVTTGIQSQTVPGGLSVYSGVTDAYAVAEDSRAISGSRVLRTTEPSADQNRGEGHRIVSQSGLPSYPEIGDTFEFYVRPLGNGGFAGFLFGVQDAGNFYLVDVDDGGTEDFGIRKFTDGGFTHLARTNGFSWSADVWYRIEVDWRSDGSLRIQAFNNETGSSEITLASGQDPDPLTGGGIGWRYGRDGGGTTGHWLFDSVYRLSDDGREVIEDFEQRAPGGLIWDTAADWDAAVSSSGVVHEAVANTDHVDAGVVKQGYSVAEPYRASDLLAYLPFHDDGGSTTSDISPHGNDATVNGPTPNRAGPLGTTGYGFDGSDDRVLLQDLPLYDRPASGSATHNVWYRTSSTSIMFPLYLRGVQGDGSAHLMGVNDDSVAGSEPGSLRFMVRSNSENSSAIVGHGGEVYDGNWHMLTLVYDPTNGVTGYFDGTAVATSSTTMSEDLTFGYLGIGAGPDFTANPNWFDGSLWDYRYYSGAFSAAEVRQLYDVATTPGTITTASKEAN